MASSLAPDRMMKLCWAIVTAVAVTAHVTHAQTTRIQLGFTGAIDYLAAFVAKDQGFFSKRNLDVSLTYMPNGASIPPGLLGNSLQIGGIAVPVVLQAKAGGFPIKIVAGASVTTKQNPNGWVVARANSNIKGPRDLTGKRIGVPAVGSYYHVLLRHWLEDNGVTAKAVTYVEVPFVRLGDVLKSGQIDAAALGQPYAGRIIASGTGYSVAAYTTHYPDDTLSNLYCATESWVRANPGVPAAFRSALDEAAAFISANPDKARESAVRYLKVTPDIVAKLPLANYRSAVTPAQLLAWNTIARRQALVQRDVDPASLLTP
jgi:NitT/TauT family transport system substrate-binding protein